MKDFLIEALGSVIAVLFFIGVLAFIVFIYVLYFGFFFSLGYLTGKAVAYVFNIDNVYLPIVLGVVAICATIFGRKN